MEYNSQRSKLIIPEYGRNLQKMIEMITTIEDRTKRTQLAYLIVDIMAQLHTLTKEKDSDDLRNKLWDHLHIISDFKLDVDSPYPVPDREVLTKSPKKLAYPKHRMRYAHYGKNIELIIDKAIGFEDGPDKDAFVKNIANQLKKSYLTWNRDSVDDDLIILQLGELSHFMLKLSEGDQLQTTSEILGPQKKKNKQQSNPNQQQNRQNQQQNKQNPQQKKQNPFQKKQNQPQNQNKWRNK
jgi:hypothetical protein